MKYQPEPDKRSASDVECAQRLNALFESAANVQTIPKGLSPEGKKYDNGKDPMHLISPLAIKELSKVLGFGAQKYDSWNWAKGIQYSRVISAVLRHIFAWLGGETLDPESGLNHLAHAMCGLMFLLHFAKTRPELDDRYKDEVPKNS